MFADGSTIYPWGSVGNLFANVGTTSEWRHAKENFSKSSTNIMIDYTCASMLALYFIFAIKYIFIP